MKTITIDNLNIDMYDGNIGVAVSGGADSALLLYILMKNITSPITIVSCGNGLTNNQEPVNALKITNEIMKLTGKKNIHFMTHWAENKQLNSIIFKLTNERGEYITDASDYMMVVQFNFYEQEDVNGTLKSMVTILN